MASAGLSDLSLDRMKSILVRVDLRADRIDIRRRAISADFVREIPRGQIFSASTDRGEETKCAPFSMRTKDGRPRMISPDASEPLIRQRRNSLLKAVVRGYAWRKELEAGKALSIGDIAKRADLSDRYVSRMIKFGYLAPDIIEAIVNDDNSGEAALLEYSGTMPFDWREQRKLFASVLGR